MMKKIPTEAIAFQPDAHEVGTDPVITRRKVKCQELSLTQAEVYQNGGEGLRPEAKLLIPYDRDYKGERELKYRGERWKVLRKPWGSSTRSRSSYSLSGRVYSSPSVPVMVFVSKMVPSSDI